MVQVTMPKSHPVSASFSISGYRSVDAAEDPAAFFAYLDSVAAAFRDMTEAGLDLLALRPGGRALDVGCGHGACAPRLAQRVGPSGHVFGVDLSRAMIEEARRRFRADARMDFRPGDAMALPFADEAFDAARSDRVFMFVRDPGRALAELIRVKKRGGRIAITEGDIGSHALDAADVETTRAVLAAMADRLPNGWIGRKLRAMFIEAGLSDVEVRLTSVLSTSFAEWHDRMGAGRAVSLAIEDGEVPKDRGAAWLEDLRQRDMQDRFTATGMFFTVAGSRPAR
jgi:ubiquinone/menaquinone biosynthesis C-methylase UbiE